MLEQTLYFSMIIILYMYMNWQPVQYNLGKTNITKSMFTQLRFGENLPQTIPAVYDVVRDTNYSEYNSLISQVCS